LLGLPFFIVGLAVYALANGFTTTMVVPTMLHTDRGVLSGWRRFWPTLRGDLKEYTVYSLMVIVLHIGAGIITGLGLLVALVVLAIPFGIVGFGIFVAAGSSLSLPVAAVLGVLAVVFVVLLLLLGALVRVPIKAFFRFYALLLLGDTDSDLDLIPDLRDEIRTDDQYRGGPGGGGGRGGGPGGRGESGGGRGGGRPGGRGESGGGRGGGTGGRDDHQPAGR
jgi:hypothetical protein